MAIPTHLRLAYTALFWQNRLCVAT